MKLYLNKYYQFVWGDWFRLLDEVIADPRCQVDRDTVMKRLLIYPIQEAVLLTPTYDPNNLNFPRKKSQNKISYERYKKRIFTKLKQGVPLDLVLKTRKEIYKQVAPENPIKYSLWMRRIERGYNIFNAFQDFWCIVYGKKYASYAALRKEYPWLYTQAIQNYNHLLEVISC